MPQTPTQSQRADFRAFSEHLKDRQIREVYHKERNAGRLAYADEAAQVARERGIDLEG